MQIDGFSSKLEVEWSGELVLQNISITKLWKKDSALIWDTKWILKTISGQSVSGNYETIFVEYQFE